MSHQTILALFPGWPERETCLISNGPHVKYGTSSAGAGDVIIRAGTDQINDDLLRVLRSSICPGLYHWVVITNQLL
jgi:hypothetical protein